MALKKPNYKFDLDKGNVEALCYLYFEGSYQQPYDTDTQIIECYGGQVSLKFFILKNMFEKDSAINDFKLVSPNDDLIHPHALITFKIFLTLTPIVEFAYFIGLQ